MEVELVDGKRGELTFLVDGRVVAKKGLFFKPSVPKVLQAVRAANNANPGDQATNALATRVSASGGDLSFQSHRKGQASKRASGRTDTDGIPSG
jgi:hypothetical protein